MKIHAALAGLASLVTLASFGTASAMAGTSKTHFTSTSAVTSSSATSSQTKSLSGALKTGANASSNTKVVEVLHRAYIISKPKSKSTKIKLEQIGTQLTIEHGGNKYWWHVKDKSGNQGYITTSAHYTELASPIHVQLPAGVTLDPSITPIAPVSATNKAKFDAILKVAKSKLGTPYRLDHNEDRGQYGFDCSNFTAYVYHHALGYVISSSSIKQYQSVGKKVPTADMKPGDLLTFEDGKHCGIYIGHHKMIQCGGGLRKVGYLSVAPGSYWYKHLSAVKRMY